MRLETNKIDVEKLADCEIKSKALVNNLKFIQSSHVELKNSVAFNKAMEDIKENESNIAETIRSFNQYVNDFNEGMETFPDSLINRNFNKRNKLATFDSIIKQKDVLHVYNKDES